jgi:thymidine phosphorylase
LGILGSAAKVRASKYELLREVWKIEPVPSTMYGLDVRAYSDGELDKLDLVQNRVVRLALGAPRQTAVEALRGDMGWSTFKGEKNKISFEV